jgi:type II secretory pathway pseudopilin PulG
MAERSNMQSSQAAGFTLAEMLAALGILLVGIMALIGSLSSSVAQRRTTDARLAAVALCEQALHRIRHEGIVRSVDAESDLDLEIRNFEDQTAPGFDGMTWSATAVIDEDRPDIWMVRVVVRWLDEGEDATEEFLRVLPRNLTLGRRVRRYRDQLNKTQGR